MTNVKILYDRVLPDEYLKDFVDCIWMLHNPSFTDKEVMVLPDGNMDLFFTKSLSEEFHITLLGISTQPEQAVIKAQRTTFAISFKPLGIEYILRRHMVDWKNTGENLGNNFWGISENDLADFPIFVLKITAKLKSLIPEKIDNRKLQLFQYIYASHGGCTVNELAKKVFWSSRQINRYFNQQIGISLKTYSSIIRFRASFSNIKSGQLYPEHHFADQSHFIKEIKRLAGVNPKKLNLNQNDRFIQFSTLLDA